MRHVYLNAINESDIESFVFGWNMIYDATVTHAKTVWTEEEVRAYGQMLAESFTNGNTLSKRYGNITVALLEEVRSIYRERFCTKPATPDAAPDAAPVEDDEKIDLDAAEDYYKRTGRCARCRRTLTADQSVTRGFGPICAKKVGIA